MHLVLLDHQRGRATWWVSTRKVDDLVKTLGLPEAGISKSGLSRICAEGDRHLEAFRSRRLEGEHPQGFCDAIYLKARVAGEPGYGARHPDRPPQRQGGQIGNGKRMTHWVRGGVFS